MLRLKSISRKWEGWISEIVDDELNTKKTYKATTLTALLFRMKQATEWTLNNLHL